MRRRSGSLGHLSPSWFGVFVSLTGLALVPACVTSPQSNTTIEDEEGSIQFTGLAIFEPGLRVRIQVQEGDGSFTTLRTRPVPRDGQWTVNVSVPERYFEGLCGEAVFRAVTVPGGDVLPAADSLCLAALEPGEDVSSCATDTIVLQRGGAGTFVGDLALDGPADAAAHQCLEVVEGNLTILGGRVETEAAGFYGPGVEFALPNLVEVTGNLSIDGDRAESVSLPLLEQVGQNLSLLMPRFGTLIPPVMMGDDPTFEFPVTDLDLPILASVGGSVDLHNERETAPAGSAAFPYNFDLASLATLGGGVFVENSVFPSQIQGLNTLTEIHGDVLIDWGPTDLDSTTLLSAVTHIEGNLELVGPPNSRILMEAVATVDGDVTVRARDDATEGAYPRMAARVFGGLTNVGGSVYFDRTSAGGDCTLVFPSLTSVSGVFQITDGSGRGKIGATGATELTLGSLVVSGTSGEHVPFFDDVVIADGGGIEFVNNAALCPCQVDAFVALQESAGWTGTATNSGNGAEATCDACPATFCP